MIVTVWSHTLLCLASLLPVIIILAVLKKVGSFNILSLGPLALVSKAARDAG